MVEGDFLLLNSMKRNSVFTVWYVHVEIVVSYEFNRDIPVAQSDSIKSSQPFSVITVWNVQVQIVFSLALVCCPECVC